MRRVLLPGLIAAALVVLGVTLLRREASAPAPTSGPGRATAPTEGPTLEGTHDAALRRRAGEPPHAVSTEPRIEPLRVTVLLPDGSRAPEAYVMIERAPRSGVESAGGPELPLIPGKHVQADARGEAVLSIAYEGPVRLFASSGGATWNPHGARSRILTLPRASGTAELQLESCSKHWILPDDPKGQRLSARLRLLTEGAASADAQPPLAHWRSGLGNVWGQLDGALHVEVSVDGYVTRTVTLPPLAPGSTEFTHVVLEPDATVGWFTLGAPARLNHAVAVMARRTDAPDASWQLVEPRPFSHPWRNASTPDILHWPSAALARGTHALLVVRGVTSPRPGEYDPVPAHGGWVPALLVGEREARAKVAFEEGIVARLADAQGALRPLSRVHVFAPDGLPLPVFEMDVHAPAARKTPTSGGGSARLRLFDPGTPLPADAVLGPYPFPFVTLWLESTDGSTETVVVGSK